MKNLIRLKLKICPSLFYKIEGKNWHTEVGSIKDSKETERAEFYKERAKLKGEVETKNLTMTEQVVNGGEGMKIKDGGGWLYGALVRGLGNKKKAYNMLKNISSSAEYYIDDKGKQNKKFNADAFYSQAKVKIEKDKEGNNWFIAEKADGIHRVKLSENGSDSPTPTPTPTPETPPTDFNKTKEAILKISHSKWNVSEKATVRARVYPRTAMSQQGTTASKAGESFYINDSKNYPNYYLVLNKADPSKVYIGKINVDSGGFTTSINLEKSLHDVNLTSSDPTKIQATIKSYLDKLS